jgi:hypothetical protein
LNTLSDKFRLPTEDDLVEEFDGLNHYDAQKLVFVISLPVLMKSHAIQLKLGKEIIALRVPNLYKLELGLPIEIIPNENNIHSYFDQKLRKLFVVLKVK